MQQISKPMPNLAPPHFDKEVLFESHFGKIQQSLRELKQEIIFLEKMKAQSVVHIQQYAHDISVIQNITEKIRTFLKYQISEDKILEHNEIQGTKPLITQPVFQKLLGGQVEWSLILNKEFTPQNSPLIENISLRYAISTQAIISAIKFSSDGRFFAFTDQNFLFLHNSFDGTISQCWDIQQFKAGDCSRVSLAFSFDGRYLALGASNYSILIFDLNDNQLHFIFKGHTFEISSVIFLKNNTQLISGGFDSQLIFWDLKQKAALNSIKYGPTQIISRLALFQDDSMLAVAFIDGNVSLLSLNSNSIDAQKTFRAHIEPLMGIASSKSGKLLSTISQDSTIKLWKYQQNIIQNISSLTGHSDFVLTSCFTPNEKILISGSKDETIRGWNLSNSSNIWVIQTKMNTIFDIDHHPTKNTFISCNGDGFICIWDYK